MQTLRRRRSVLLLLKLLQKHPRLLAHIVSLRTVQMAKRKDVAA